jgi:hypothetical protein
MTTRISAVAIDSQYTASPNPLASEDAGSRRTDLSADARSVGGDTGAGVAVTCSCGQPLAACAGNVVCDDACRTISRGNTSMPPMQIHQTKTRTATPAQNEWGVFDPEQAGMPAAIRALNDAQHDAMFAATATPEVAVPAAPASLASQLPDGCALYAVESPLRCPQCQSAIRTFRALRVLRTHVPFMSTLPRKGYVLVCPECAGLLSAELSGLL